SDRHWFWLLSITAGICEEIIFRGFLMWLISVWTGVIFAAIISSVIFGLEHVYLGVAQVPRIALLGLGFVIVVLISGSLLPAMVIHATMDLSSGEISFRVAQASLATTTAPPLTS
ncbi:MAG TPA: CPBP family intramembrane glutamic endopeptidase, partial [Candidatus Acidoferrales bacterium]|nr:CPBP family intramembrane glutamic endopeptidase [Candidatus Acidoferrales bacterium]